MSRSKNMQHPLLPMPLRSSSSRHSPAPDKLCSCSCSRQGAVLTPVKRLRWRGALRKRFQRSRFSGAPSDANSNDSIVSVIHEGRTNEPVLRVLGVVLRRIYGILFKGKIATGYVSISSVEPAWFCLHMQRLRNPQCR